MPRGITQDQVNAAADTLLAAGENPTVEKVRAALGTGSPNTVTRMLDAWRVGLGERLRQLQALPDIPTAVGEAMLALWHLATDHALQAIAGRFAEERAALESTRAALVVERDTWATRLAAADTALAQGRAALEHAEHACATLEGQLKESHVLRADFLQQRDRLQGLCDQYTTDLQALRQQLDDQRATAVAERHRQDTYVRQLENRTHQDIDRARQESKQWQQRLEAAERAHREAQGTLQERYEGLSLQWRETQHDSARYAGQIVALERALADAYVAAKPAKRKATTPRPSGKRAKRTPA